MQTIKTAFVVILLSAMLYGIYVVVNTPPTRPPRDVAEQLNDKDATTLVVEDGGEDSADSPAPKTEATTRRATESRPLGFDRGARELPTVASRGQDSPAASNLLDSPSPATTRDSSPLGPNASRTAASSDPESPVGAEAQFTRAPVGLEQAETTQPPLPPRGQDPLPTVPVPDLKLPPADRSTPSAARTAATDTDPSVDTRSNSSFDKPSPASFSPEQGRPDASNASFNVESPASGTSPANDSPPSSDSPNTSPSGASPVNTAPSPSLPSVPFGKEPAGADATAHTAPAANAAPAANKGMVVNPSSLAAGQDGVRFDPKEAVFERGWKEAQLELSQGKPLPALTVLSHLYTDPRLTAAERRQLQDALDPLAARVIYSTEHLLDQPYFVRRGDSLQAIAEQYRLPWQLLANINGVRDPEFLVPGSKLKVFRGPMRADVDLTTQEVTLYWKQLYAGRFPISVGQDPAPAPGEYEVQEKLTNRDYIGPGGQTIPGGSAQNPYGTVYLGLGRNLAIHGAPLADGAPSQGCVSLSPRDAEDVFAILSVGSTVTIRR